MPQYPRATTTSGISPISLANNATIDAFNRLRVSDPHTLFDSKQLYDNQPLFWDEDTSGVGAGIVYDVDKSESVLTVGTVDAEYAIRQSKRYINYQTGHSQLVLITGNIQGGKENVTKRIGFFDDQNGIFFETNGTDFYVTKRTYTTGAAIDTQVIQADWNIDSFNGRGSSRTVLDLSKTQIFVIDYEWLGVGRVRLGFVIR